jgi:hypothetical protein
MYQWLGDSCTSINGWEILVQVPMARRFLARRFLYKYQLLGDSCTATIGYRYQWLGDYCTNIRDKEIFV